MANYVKIESIANAWIVTYDHNFVKKQETFKTFDEVVTRIKELLDVEWYESHF